MDPKQLAARNTANKRKPDFLIRESKFSAKVKKRWRFPRGKHSKRRQFHRGRPPMPTPGYGAPKSAHGLDRSGLVPVRIQRAQDLESFDSRTQGAVISSTMGSRKKIELLKLAQQKKITVLNVKDIASKIATIEKLFAERKAARKAKISERTSKKSAKKDEKSSEKEDKKKQATKEKTDESAEESSAKPKTTKKSATDKSNTPIDTKLQEKKELDKTLTKRQ